MVLTPASSKTAKTTSWQWFKASSYSGVPAASLRAPSNADKILLKWRVSVSPATEARTHSACVLTGGVVSFESEMKIII